MNFPRIHAPISRVPDYPSLDCLKPVSVLYAAEEDMRRRERNLEDRHRVAAGDMEHYAFHRDHVRKAESAFDLIKIALEDIERGKNSGKRMTRALYNSQELLREALGGRSAY